jgi:hypothetical protein
MDEQVLETLGRMATHLPEGDLTLIILKGHLLIEEQLFAIVRESVVFPDALLQWRPRYRDISAVAKALHYRKEEDWLWESVYRLNTLRNDLAHKLEPEDLESRLQQFIGPLETRIGSRANDNLTERVRNVFPFILGALTQIRKEVLQFKSVHCFTLNVLSPMTTLPFFRRAARSERPAHIRNRPRQPGLDSLTFGA